MPVLLFANLLKSMPTCKWPEVEGGSPGPLPQLCPALDADSCLLIQTCTMSPLQVLPTTPPPSPSPVVKERRRLNSIFRRPFLPHNNSVHSNSVAFSDKASPMSQCLAEISGQRNFEVVF